MFLSSSAAATSANALSATATSVTSGTTNVTTVSTTKDDDQDPTLISTVISAASRGDEATVASALLNPAVDLNQARGGTTALAAAAKFRHLAVVDLLLRHPRRVDPNARSRGRRTPLLSVLEESKYAVQYRAAVKGNLGELGIAYLAVVQRLLEDDRVDPNAEDDHGRGALDVACQPFMSEYVPHEVPPSVPLLRLLLANKRTQPSQHQWRAAPFYDAALAWVQRQRKRQRVCGGGNDFGSEATPVEFIVAAATGDVPTVESGLRNAAHVNPNMNAGFHGGMLWYRTLPPTSSALAVAVANDRGAVVRTLLQDARVDVNQQDRHGRTPLTLAAAACNVPLVQALLAHPDVNVNHVAWRSAMAPVSLAAHS
jgi:hypothetical protein